MVAGLGGAFSWCLGWADYSYYLAQLVAEPVLALRGNCPVAERDTAGNWLVPGPLAQRSGLGYTQTGWVAQLVVVDCWVNLATPLSFLFLSAKG